jgi:hypothetical protein
MSHLTVALTGVRTRDPRFGAADPSGPNSVPDVSIILDGVFHAGEPAVLTHQAPRGIHIDVPPMSYPLDAFGRGGPWTPTRGPAPDAP